MTIERQLWFWGLALVAAAFLLSGLREVLLPFVTGIVLAYFLNPVADRLQRLGFSRTLAALVILAFGTVVIAGLMLVIIPILAEQTRQLALSLPSDIERLRPSMEAYARERLGAYFATFETGIAKAIAAIGDSWTGALGSVASFLLGKGQAVFSFMTLLLLTPIVVFYLLVDWHPLLDRVESWLPRDHADRIRHLAADMNTAIAAFVRGQGTICLLLGIFYALALSLLGLRYGLLIGLLTGVLMFVPIIGWFSGLLIALAVAFAQWGGDPLAVAKIAAVFAAGQAIDTAFLSPRIVGQRIGLHPVWMIFAMFAGSALFGFVGTLLAVPMAAAIAVLVRFGLASYLASPLYRGQGGTDRASTPGDRIT